MTPRWRLTLLDLIAVLFSVAVFAVAVAVFQYIFGQDPEKPLRDQQIAILTTLAETPPASLEFSLGSSTVLIRDPAEIAEFLHLLVEPELVPRHHSHPEDEIGFQLEGSISSYILGRDSQADDEYWLQLNEGRYPLRTIKLLHSEALTAWLIRRGLVTE